ncbi:MAG: class D sortase [Lachnospiraceae bacterium]|nr:class D sortase [Candidatus Merdinaster equi]
MKRKKQSNSKSNRKTAGKVLITAGSLIILFVIAINVIDLVKSNNAINDFKKRKNTIWVDDTFEVIPKNNSGIDSDAQDSVGEVDDSESEVLAENPDSIDEPDEESEVKKGKKSDDVAMCLLRIPKIDLEEAVKEGSTSGVLSSALGHIEDTALPGEDGNCCIAGHRNYVFGKYFNRLEEVTPGDIIELETLDDLYIYEVTSTEVVEPEEVRVLDYAEGRNLTLITCTPFMIATHRLIVHATMK